MLSDFHDLLNVENLAETGHVKHILNQRLKVAYNKFATFLSNHFVGTQEYTQTGTTK